MIGHEPALALCHPKKQVLSRFLILRNNFVIRTWNPEEEDTSGNFHPMFVFSGWHCHIFAFCVDFEGLSRPHESHVLYESMCDGVTLNCETLKNVRSRQLCPKETVHHQRLAMECHLTGYISECCYQRQ